MEKTTGMSTSITTKDKVEGRMKIQKIAFTQGYD
jgi:hypothetical protein